MEIYTAWKRPPRSYQKHGGKVMIERQGYVSAKDRIEAIMEAGKRLIATRGEQYDFKDGEEIDEEFYDPTRSKSFDRVDASILESQVNERLIQAKIKVEEDKKKASENDQDVRREVLSDEVVKKVEKP